MTLNVFIAIGAIAAAMAAFLWLGVPSKTKGTLKTGVTFSRVYAEELGLNWRELLTAMLDDLHIRRFRIPAYWSVVEPEPGQFDWSTLDYQLDEIARRDGKVLLAIGLKLPRWPECWMPGWARKLDVKDEQTARLEYLKAAVERYNAHPALEAWQVENEADFPFGLCPKPNRAFHKKEIDFVRSLDPKHPVTTTDSGELASWLTVNGGADALGVSVYRTVRTPWGSVWRYTWIPPYWYYRHALLVRPWVKRVFVSEFQMEPWSERSLTVTPLEEQFSTLDADQMQKNFAFSERMRINEIYFWGAEWWWWMKTRQGDARFWETAKIFFQAHT